jgi:hypothetical protein
MRELTGGAAGTGGTCVCRGRTSHLRVQVPGRKPEATPTSLAKNYLWCDNELWGFEGASIALLGRAPGGTKLTHRDLMRSSCRDHTGPARFN